MEVININKDKGEVLILKTDLLLHPKSIEALRNDIIKQIESGVVFIPNNFTFTIHMRDCLGQPEIVTRKRMIDVDTWIDKLAKIVSDPEAPEEYKDYCMHLISEIEAEFRAQEFPAMQKGGADD